jgi:MOSC domain-containing protein YiiM
MTGRIVQINVPSGGVPKRPVPRARVTRSGLEGDAHRDTEHQGGLDRALCLFSVERIEALQAEGHPVEPGALGENLTVAGLDWARAQLDDFLRLGEDVLVPGEIAAGDPVEHLTLAEVARHLAVGLGG